MVRGHESGWGSSETLAASRRRRRTPIRPRLTSIWLRRYRMAATTRRRRVTDDVAAVAELASGAAAARNPLPAIGPRRRGASLLRAHIELDPTLPAAHFNRGNVFWLRKMNLAAVASYEQALRLQPNYPEVYNGLSITCSDMLQPDLAVDYALRGLRQRPKSGRLHANLAIALAHLGRGEESIAHARKAVELRPTTRPRTATWSTG